MTSQDPGSARDAQQPAGDPWLAFAYLVSGVGFYGLLGWLADRWLGTSFLVAVGLVLGAGLGIYLTWARFTRPASTHPDRQEKN